MLEKVYNSLAGRRNDAGVGAGIIPSFLMLAIAVMAFALGSCGGTGPLPPADTTAPTVRAVNPINGALNVPLDTAIIITFSEAMDPASINSQAIILSSESGTTVAGTVSYSNMTAEFKPTRDLNSSTWYSVRINDSVRDAAGNAMNAPFGYSFRTGDTIPPQVNSTNPEDETFDHPVNASIFITFSEQMDPDTINATTITLRDAESTVIPGMVSYAGSKTAIFDPTSDLRGTTLYTANVSTFAKDLAGNALSGNMPNGDYQWSFTTGAVPDKTPPIIAERTPAIGATGVDVNTAITVTFSEPVDESTIQFVLSFVLSTETITVPWTKSYIGSTATFTTAGLSYNTLYTAQVSGAKDSAQNQMVNDTWSFQTAKAGTSILLQSSPNPSLFNSLVTFTAIVTSASGTPTGVVTFKDGTSIIGSPIALSGGVASFTTSDLALGSHSITAVYSGVGIFSDATSSAVVQVVDKANAVVTLDGLNQMYDGTPKAATATTAPAGLPVTITYDGSTTPPTIAGSYEVIATINDAIYSGSATGTMMIGKANATVLLNDMTFTYDGTPKAATASTDPAGLTVTFTYNGSTTPPTNAESYYVVGTISGTNYQGSATGTMVINKATPVIAWTNPADITYGTALSTTQLNAAANAAGSFVYTPADGAVLEAGPGQTLSVAFTPSDTANYNPASKSVLINVKKATATVNLTSLSQTYDGTPKTVYATTTPDGLIVNITYDGSAGAPTNAGSYSVVGTIVSPNYEGSATGSLVVNKATPVITWTNPADITYGTALSAIQLNATAPIGGTFIYAPAVGTVLNGGAGQTLSVEFIPTDAVNYTSATKSVLINVSKETATVMLDSLVHTYDGVPKSAAASTNPVGLTVILTYNGSATPPTNAGTYEVVGTISDINYQGSAAGTLVINKAIAVVTLGSLNQTYDGAPKSATAGTVPTNLAVIFTYDGSGIAPTNAGSYVAVGIVDDVNYQGIASGTLVINKATAMVTLGSLNQTYDGMQKSATATTSPSGLLVDFTYDGSPAMPTYVGSYTVVGTVVNPNYEGSATATLVISQATPVITWSNPADITYGTPLSDIQLNATANVTGVFEYSPSAGTILSVGPHQPLSVIFTPEDTVNYTSASTTVHINVVKN